MKIFRKKSFLVTLVAIGAFIMAACSNKKSSTTKTTTEPTPTVEPEPEPDYKKSERAMENFGRKLAQYNYTIEGNDVLTTYAVSEEKLIFKFKHHPVSNYAAMTVDGETFQGRISGDTDPISHLLFLDKKPAAVLAGKKLPNYWFKQESTNKSIWEYFVNDPNQAYHYKGRNSYDVASVVGSMCDFATTEIESIKEVTMDFDKEDVSVATINAIYHDGTSSTEYKPLTVKITFGTSQSDTRVDEWINDEDRELPTPYGNYTKWTDVGEYALLLQSATNIHQDIDNYIPYIDFASYAVTYNGDTFLTTDKSFAKIRDYHGTQANVDTYISYLTSAPYNYTPVEVGEETHYRLKLRERDGEECYSDIQVVKDDDGLLLTVGLYYTGDTYKSLAEFNTAITAKEFVAFPNTDLFTDYDGLDYSYHAYESHTCLLDWKLYIIMTVKYTDQNAVKTYIDNYGELVEDAGYTYNKNDEAWVKSDREHAWHVEFTFKANNTLEIIAKVQDYVDPAIIKTKVEAAGFPVVDMTKETDAKDLIAYMKFMYNQDCIVAYEVRYKFDNPADARQFTDSYITALKLIGFKISGAESGMEMYVKGNLKIRVVKAQGTFAGLDYFVYRVNYS